ncbi:MAG: DNA-binding HxlR family transcriptional regulator [Natrialbaceae archaeon]|jgi:DNA-binding HxlR family transcriptional regulator
MLVEREIVSEKPFRVEYSLTDRGTSLEAVIIEMRDWGTENLKPAPDKDSPIA